MNGPGVTVDPADDIAQSVAEALEGEYRLLETVGPARLGTRYRALDLRRGEEVILSVLPPFTDGAREAGARFLEQALAASRFEHPHAAPVHGYGVSGPYRWSVLLLTTDRSFADRMASGEKFSVTAVGWIAQQVASVLDQAHRHGLCHGALTPADILIAPDGWVRVQGIGLAAGADGEAHPADDRAALASMILAALPDQLPATVRAFLGRAMRPNASIRPGELLDLVAALDGASLRQFEPSAQPGVKGGEMEWEKFLSDEPIGETPSPARPGRWLGVAGLALLGMLATLFLLRPPPDPPRTRSTETTVAPVATATPAPTPASVPTTVEAPPPEPAAVPAPRANVPRAAPRRPRPTLPAAGSPRPAPVDTVKPLFAAALYVGTEPWGEASIDGERIGNTPVLGHLLAPGRHILKVTQEGYMPYEVAIDLPSGDTLRLTRIVLAPLAP